MQMTNATALVRDGETFVVIYNDGQEGSALRAIGRWASDPEIDFNWFNAACMVQKIRKTATEATDVNR